MVLYFLVDSIRDLKAEVAHVQEDLQNEDDNPVFEMEFGTSPQKNEFSEQNFGQKYLTKTSRTAMTTSSKSEVSWSSHETSMDEDSRRHGSWTYFRCAFEQPVRPALDRVGVVRGVTPR